MGKFHFNVVYAGHVDQDEAGTNCPDLGAAQREARAILRELSSDALAQDLLFAPIGIDICDAAGTLLAHVTTVDAIAEIT